MPDVLFEKDGRTAIVTLNRPEARNALTLNVVKELAGHLQAAEADGEVRCVVLTGAGGHFCSGADLRKTLSEVPNLMEQLDGYVDDFHAVVKGIVHCSKPVIAMLDGAAAGFGADLAFASDFRIATRDAYLQEGFSRIGLMPDGGGTFWLPHLVGRARATQLVLLGEKLDATTLHQLGLLASLVEKADLHSATMSLARRLEKGPPLAYAESKRAMLASLGDIDAALKREKEGQLRLLRSKDAMEGIFAWIEKREAAFTGS